MQPHPHKADGFAVLCGLGQRFVFQLGLLHALSQRFYCIGLALSFIVIQIVLQNAPGRLHTALHHGKIFLLKPMLLNLRRKRRSRLGAAGIHHHAAHRAVQPVNAVKILCGAAQCIGQQLRNLMLTLTAGRFAQHHIFLFGLQYLHAGRLIVVFHSPRLSAKPMPRYKIPPAQQTKQRRRYFTICYLFLYIS